MAAPPFVAAGNVAVLGGALPLLTARGRVAGMSEESGALDAASGRPLRVAD